MKEHKIFNCKCGWSGNSLNKSGCVTHGDVWYVCPQCGEDASKCIIYNNQINSDKMKNKIYEALTVQALLMRNEIFSGGGIDKDCFDATYLNGIGKYEQKIAKREGIEIEN